MFAVVLSVVSRFSSYVICDRSVGLVVHTSTGECWGGVIWEREQWLSVPGRLPGRLLNLRGLEYRRFRSAFSRK
eukprot:1393096-Amorphochlora_amoeboformis.AAC.2